MSSLPLPSPTDARPGSPEKVEVLRQRYEADEQMHHPADERRYFSRPAMIFIFTLERRGRHEARTQYRGDI